MDNSSFNFSVIPIALQKGNNTNKSKLSPMLLKKITKKLVNSRLVEENFKEYELGPILAIQKLKNSNRQHKSETIKRKNNSIAR